MRPAQRAEQVLDMGWFSKKDSGYFLVTVVPGGSDSGPRVARYLGGV